ncbi:DUF6932 family protein [Streptomyces sp. NBC_00539]|uniref:DUF6932 family protein n=1 Tax=Streptomyces sp. NBC_00539 TaxID=2975770 RepID=UPI002E8039E2|nr:hypothetical protein [Streptomyces sp. NBC_00539]WUC65501.1 hypothetical protein OG861_15370 [Streptomyces sp. NBC_00539]
MKHLPALDPDTGFLPPGRYAASLDVLYAEFVEALDSPRRRELWSEWEHHRAAVEAWTGEITRLWVGGSFISGKQEPSDVDVTYLLRSEVYDRLDQESLVSLGELTDQPWCTEHSMRIDAYVVRLPDAMPFWQMMPSLFTSATSESFRDIGLYDEVWQRTRASSDPAGRLGELRRGYVEVLL